jgi:hypothetical protein
MVVCLVFAPQPTAAQPLVAPTPPPATSGSLAVTITDLEDREKKLIGGEWVEVPVMLTGPTDVALLIDRFQVLFDGPSTISEGCGVNVTSGMLPIDALQAIIERTRGLAAPDLQASPIPRAPRRLDD